MNYLLLLGGNVGDVEGAFAKSVARLEEVGEVVKKSKIYRSKSWGFEGPDFLNQVVEIETGLEPLELLEFTQKVERELGRREKSKDGKYASREIDIDILYQSGTIFDSAGLTIPHPLIEKREFVLVPLCERWGDHYDVRRKRTCKEMLENLRHGK